MHHSTTSLQRPTGMRAFSIIWVGQLVSFLGTGMTRFAMTIWAWQLTGEATALAMVAFFSFAPLILLTPVAGALVDRSNRKLVLIVSDLGAGVATIIILLLYSTGQLQLWHLFVAGALAGAFESFQFPAFSTTISMMLPKEQYARANGMLSLAESASGIAAPLLAGVLLAFIGIGGILAIDVATFLFAVAMLAVVYIPNPPSSSEPGEGVASLWSDSIYGFRYIFRRASLLGLQLLFFISNLSGSVVFVLLAPMILARTGNNELIFGTVQSFLGIGGVVGGLLLSTWGGPTRRIHGVLLGFIGAGLLGELVIGVGQSLIIWCFGAFWAMFFVPFINGSNQAIWQAKVSPSVQGRVFSARRLIAQIAGPVGILIAGPLADNVFEPAMMPGGSLAPIFEPLVGVGPGAGMGLMIAAMGIVSVVSGLAGYAIHAIRDAEEILPDYEMTEGDAVAAL